MDNNQSAFKFQGSNMIVHAKGPNMVKNMVIHSGLRTNLMSSTMNMPRNFDEHSYTEPTRSLYYGRDTSPTASVHSEFQPRNFHQPFHQGYSQRSTCSRRQGSPVSITSIDSSSTTDIVQAIYNGKFTDCDCRKIYRALKNSHFSRMSERRRKMKLKFETRQKISDSDSGEQGSKSSISSDDSTRTGYNKKCKENMPQIISDFRSTDRQSRNNTRDDMYGVYADSNTQNPYRRDGHLHHVKNMASLQENTQIKANNLLFSQTNTLSVPRNAFTSNSMQRNNLNASVYSAKSSQNQTIMSQRDRFENRFQLPSQRFKNSFWPFPDHEKNRPICNMRCGNNNQNKHMACLDEDSDGDDNIIPDQAERSQLQQKNSTREKRNIDTLGSIPVSASKKHKTYNNNEAMKLTQKENGIKNNDFVFVKPVFPVRKSVPAKTREKLISKSAGPFVNTVFNGQDKTNQSSASLSVYPPSQEKEPELELSDSTQLTTSDMSIRPSFIKRKLFTQTLDVTERKNNSCENIATDSPQSNIYNGLSREKHKTRKLTSQSLLSRDVNQDDSNLLDLIHKIVPPSQVNTTKQSKVTMDRTVADDKWDVTSIISTCNNDSVSDTYTDDEIFNVANNEKIKSTEQPSKDDRNKKNDIKKETLKPETIKAKNTVIKKCSVVVQNMQSIPMVPEVVAKPSPVKNPLQDRIYAFWNMDVESDYECGTPIKHNEKVIQGTPKISIAKQSGITKYKDVKSTSSPTKQTRHATTDNSKALIVPNNDLTLVKTLKKTNEQVITKTNTKLVNNAKSKNSQPDKSHKVAKASPATIIRTRRQLETAGKSTPVKKASLASKKKKSSDNKTSEKKPSSDLTNTKRSRNKKQNNSLVAEKTKKNERNNKTIRQPKLTDTTGDADTLFCKVLRSRHIDLSSSFNSDQFELTGISRVRTPRTSIKVTSKR